MKKKIIIGISIAVVIIGLVVGLVIAYMSINNKKILVESLKQALYTGDSGSIIYNDGSVYKFNEEGEKEKTATIPIEDLNQIKEYINQLENKTETQNRKNPLMGGQNPSTYRLSIHKNDENITLSASSYNSRTQNTSECANALKELIYKYIQ